MLTERLIAIIFGSCCLLLVIGAILIIWRGIHRHRQGSDVIEQRGWQRLPDHTNVMPGWDGWPFMDAVEPGRASDIVTGDHRGTRFLTLRWTQKDHQGPPRANSTNNAIDRYNIVALQTEITYPHLTIVRGRHKIHRHKQRSGPSEFETGDANFDHRWQTLGDPEFGHAILTQEVRDLMDDSHGAWVFQPGWITRVTRWTFYSGEEQAIEEMEKIIAPLRAVPADVWRRYGGAPRFLSGAHPGHDG